MSGYVVNVPEAPDDFTAARDAWQWLADRHVQWCDDLEAIGEQVTRDVFDVDAMPDRPGVRPRRSPDPAGPWRPLLGEQAMSAADVRAAYADGRPRRRARRHRHAALDAGGRLDDLRAGLPDLGS